MCSLTRDYDHGIDKQHVVIGLFEFREVAVKRRTQFMMGQTLRAHAVVDPWRLGQVRLRRISWQDSIVLLQHYYERLVTGHGKGS